MRIFEPSSWSLRGQALRVPGGRVPALGLAAAACFGAVTAASVQAQAAGEGRAAGAEATLTYRLTTEVNGAAWGEWTVLQGREVAIARGANVDGSGAVALVSGPAVGGLPAEPKETGLLSTLFDPAAALEPGSRKSSTYATGTAVVDSLQLALLEGDAHETIGGHEARHHVLTARLWWRHLADDGPEIPVFETGTADLWFAADLPFSWIPFAVHPHTPGLAFPLAHGWPEVGWAAVAEYGDRLESLGLLLRARTRDRIQPGNEPDAVLQLAEMEYERSVTVSGVSAAADAPDAGAFADLPRVARGRAALLDVMLFLLEPCGSLQSAEAGSFRFIASGPEREYLGGGSGALVLTDAGIENSYVVATGTVSEAGAECTLVVMPGTGPRPGTFPLFAPDPGFARVAPIRADGSGSEDVAMALHVVANREALQRVLVLEEGSVRIDDAGPGGVSGTLEGEGWALELHPDHPRRSFENLRVELTFQAAPGAGAEMAAGGERLRGETTGEEARLSVDQAPATALAEPPPPGLAIALDTFQRTHELALPEGIRAVVIGPDGRWTAISPVRGGRVLLFDLEAGQAAGEITLGTELDRISSLAVSPDGGTLAVGGMGAVHVVATAGGDVIHRFVVERPGGGAAEVQALGISPSGQVLVATAGSNLVFFDLRTGERIGSRTADPSAVRRLAWSPDGSLLATTGSPVLSVWSTSDLTALYAGDARCTVDLEHPLTWVAFSSDGSRLVATDHQGNARVWEVTTCAPGTAFETGIGFIASFGLSPDGDLLLAVGDDGVLRAFALPGGEPRGTLQGDAGSAGLVLGPRGDRLLTVSYTNRAVAVWERQ